MMIGGEGVGLWGEGTKSRPNLVKIKTLMMIHVETNLFSWLKIVSHSVLYNCTIWCTACFGA